MNFIFGTVLVFDPMMMMMMMINAKPIYGRSLYRPIAESLRRTVRHHTLQQKCVLDKCLSTAILEAFVRTANHVC